MIKQIREIKNWIKNNYSIVLFCSCEVEYSGRAESFLPEGERILIIKNDNTVLVHQPNGRNPINWMPEKSNIRLEEEDGTIVINCFSVNTHERMRIVVYKIYETTNAPLVDAEQLRIVGTEDDMSQMIYDNPEIISKEFTPFSREEQTEYGFIDVFGHDKNGSLIIVECKRYTAGLSSIQQLRRYVEKIMKSKGTENITGYIAAPDITKNALRMLNDWGFEYARVEPPNRLKEYRRKQEKLTKFLE